MVFTTHIFIFYFLPIVILIYYALPKKWKNPFLTISSYVFYGWFKPWYVTLMWVSTIIDYFAAKVITAPGASPLKRKLGLLTSMCVNLGLLGFFKYYMFGAENLNWLLETFGFNGFQVMRVILPIGISFYTFQTMSYTIDIYKGTAPPVKSFADFACFVSLFPQLIAGPIVRYNTIAEQLSERTHTALKFTRGASLFMLGFSKKILLANPCGFIADSVFNSGAPTVFQSWYGVVAYAFQIYFDFCAYSDMAVGLGRMFGFEFPKNFNAPYLAKSITEVWQKWHISLSTWLRDYLYISLGGNKKGPKRTYVNLALVMLLGGLWHGSNWQFLVWGAYHGLFLGYERWRGKASPYSRLPGFIQVTITFTLMLFSWVLFRAENLSLAMDYFGAMFGVIAPAASAAVLGAKIYTPYHTFIMIISGIFVFQKVQAMDWIDKPTGKKLVIVFVLFAISLAGMFTQAFNPFLYFQF